MRQASACRTSSAASGRLSRIHGWTSSTKPTPKLAELFRSMSAGTRIATGLLLAVVVVSLVYLFQYQVTGGDEFLLGGRPFTHSELTAIEAAFAKAGLGKSRSSATDSHSPRAEGRCTWRRWPTATPCRPTSTSTSTKRSPRDSPFASRKSLEMRRWNAKQKELALIISRMQGIESATVQYDEEIKRGLTQQKQKTAMVAVQTPAASSKRTRSRRSATSSPRPMPGSTGSSITITDMTSGFTYGGAIGPDGMPEDESLYATHKLRYEREWQRKISEQLSMIPGVIVGVNVELNPEMRALDATGQARSQAGRRQRPPSRPRNRRRQSPQSGGRPGACPMASGNQPAAVATASTRQRRIDSRPKRGPTSRTCPGHDTIVVEQRAAGPEEGHRVDRRAGELLRRGLAAAKSAAGRPSSPSRPTPPSWRRSKPKRTSGSRRRSATCCRRSSRAPIRIRTSSSRPTPTCRRTPPTPPTLAAKSANLAGRQLADAGAGRLG